jgi:hypothetical protein
MDNLQWGQPWNFIFDPELGEPALKDEMKKIAENLYAYIEESLGGSQFFTLQISWSHSPDYAQLYSMYANLIVMQAGIVSWQKKNEYLNKTEILRNQAEQVAFANIGGNFGNASLSGSKPPPPPPPPPPRDSIFGGDPPYRYFGNFFPLSHVLEFDKEGGVHQFNEAPLKNVGDLTK